MAEKRINTGLAVRALKIPKNENCEKQCFWEKFSLLGTFLGKRMLLDYYKKAGAFLGK